MSDSCGWPFHHKAGCKECEAWEKMYGENLTRYMDSLVEVRAAARAERVARRKTTPPTETV